MADGDEPHRRRQPSRGSRRGCPVSPESRGGRRAARSESPLAQGAAPAPAQHDRARRRGHRRSCSSWWPSSRTCWRPRARPPATRPTPSSGRAGTIRSGTDQLGRDMLSRIIHGTRISLVVGVSSVLLALFVGVPFGHDRRLLRRAGRHARHAGDGPDPRLPDLPARHHPDGHLHADRGADRHHEGHRRHRHRAHSRSTRAWCGAACSRSRRRSTSRPAAPSACAIRGSSSATCCRTAWPRSS